jgi:phosphatidylglycerophosphate synthase
VHLHRPLAALLVYGLARTPLSANAVTMLAGVVGVLAGVAMARAPAHGAWWVAGGGLLLLLSEVLDCADGQLARLRHEQSLAGRALDGLIDPLAPTAAFVGMSLYLIDRGYPVWYVLTLGAAAGMSLIAHADFYDHAKNVYLHNMRPEIDVGGRALLRPEDVARERQRHLARGEHLLAACVWIIGRYAAGQRRRGKSAIEQDVPITRDDAQRETFRQVFRPQMRRWALLGVGTHLALLVAAALLAPLAPTAIVVTWWLFVVPGNLLLLYLTASKARRIAEYERRVASAAGD